MVISHSEPSHLPLSKPAFFMYSAASSGSPFGVGQEVEAGALEAAGLLEAGELRRDVVGRDRADQLAAARVAQVASRSEFAITALRTLMSSNGGSCVFSAM